MTKKKKMEWTQRKQGRPNSSRKWQFVLCTEEGNQESDFADVLFGIELMRALCTSVSAYEHRALPSFFQ